MSVQDSIVASALAEHALWVSLVFILVSMVGAYLTTAWVGTHPGRRNRVLWAVIVSGTACFVAIVWALATPARLDVFDNALAVALAGALAPAALHALSIFTHFGERDLLAAFAAVVLLVLLMRRYWALAALWVAATAGGGLLNRLMKAGFERARPEHTHGFVEAHGFSFPSGHATGAMACYGMLAFLLFRVAPTAWRPAIAACTVGLITGVGLSRVLLHVHFASDVLAGWAITAAWIALCILAYHVLHEKSHQV